MKINNMYPAVFTKEEDGYSIYFPHIDGAYTCGNTFEEALYMAKDCLELVLDTLEEPPIINDLNIILKENEQLILIEADMIAYKRKYYSQLIKKTLVIPQWLNDLAVQKGINFSKVLKQALKDELNIKSKE